MTTTLTDALTTLRSIIVSHPIYGARFSTEWLTEHTSMPRFGALAFRRIGDLNLRWEQGWASGVSLNITFSKEEVEKRDTKKTLLRVTADIGWSATGRNVADAVASIALYRQVTELGALIQSALDSMTLVEETA